MSTDQTTPAERLFALIASIPGSGSVDWCEPVRALLAEVRADTYSESADSAEKLAAAFHRRAESGEENGAMEVASVLRVAAGADAARAVSSVGQAPATDQTPLRDRIADALYPTYGQEDRNRSFAIADAVLAVLPATTDQTAEIERLRAKVYEWQGSYLEEVKVRQERDKEIANLRTMYDVANARTNDLIEERDQLRKAGTDRAAVLREAADRLAELRAAEREWLPATGLHKGEQVLRRMADETQPAETIPVDALARMLSAADVEINHGDYPTWDTLAESGQGEYRKAARYLLKRLRITERAPAAGARQDATQPATPDRNAVLVSLLRCLASPATCDWEGDFCRSHEWRSDAGRCPHGQAQALLAGESA
jgi:predicted HAD superfamily Cof-like phosphohydrolase